MVGLGAMPGYAIQNMLKEGHRHLSGLDEAVLKNIDACRELSTITRTSLGPNGESRARSLSRALSASTRARAALWGLGVRVSVACGNDGDLESGPRGVCSVGRREAAGSRGSEGRSGREGGSGARVS
jgi:hypothetical protein